MKIVSCHPGWTSTPGVDAAYGSSQSYLEPLRTLWQGSEGIIWLLVAPASKLESGAFYLDREAQVKHMGGHQPCSRIEAYIYSLWMPLKPIL